MFKLIFIALCTCLEINVQANNVRLSCPAGYLIEGMSSYDRTNKKYESGQVIQNLLADIGVNTNNIKLYFKNYRE